MKKTLLTILGVATLIFALTLNFRHALDDYGVLKNKLHVEVLAQSNNTGGGTSGGDSSGGGDTSGGGGSTSSDLWKRTDGDCTYTLRGQAGSTIKVYGPGGIKIAEVKIGMDGTATLTSSGASTDCSKPGNQQCTARYCPALTFSSI